MQIDEGTTPTFWMLRRPSVNDVSWINAWVGLRSTFYYSALKTRFNSLSNRILQIYHISPVSYSKDPNIIKPRGVTLQL